MPLHIVQGNVTALPRDSVLTSGTISALNGTVVLALANFTSFAITVAGTWVALLVLESSSDGGNTWNYNAFYYADAANIDAGLVVPTVSLTVSANGIYRPTATGGITHVRVRAAEYTSGTVNITFTEAEAPYRFMATQSQIYQYKIHNPYNSTTTNIAGGGQFIGVGHTTHNAGGLEVMVKCDRTLSITVQQSADGVNWDIEDTYQVPRNTGYGRSIKAIGIYHRVIATNLDQQATTFIRLNTFLVPMTESLPRILTDDGNLKIALHEDNPSIMEGTITKYHVQDIENRQLLEDIWEELKKMNMFLEIMTDEHIRDYEIDGEG